MLRVTIQSEEQMYLVYAVPKTLQPLFLIVDSTALPNNPEAPVINTRLEAILSLL